jgi:hypothetical protein
VDFSHNAMRRLAERLFDGMEDTLEEIYLRKGGMDTKILVFKLFLHFYEKHSLFFP